MILKRKRKRLGLKCYFSWGNVEPHISVELRRVMENLKQAK